MLAKSVEKLLNKLLLLRLVEVEIVWINKNRVRHIKIIKSWESISYIEIFILGKILERSKEEKKNVFLCLCLRQGFCLCSPGWPCTPTPPTSTSRIPGSQAQAIMSSWATLLQEFVLTELSIKTNPIDFFAQCGTR